MDARETALLGEVNKRRRVLTSIKIDKIASVDAPAQEHALAALRKRADDRLSPEAISALIQKQADQIKANEEILNSLRAKESEVEKNFEEIIIEIAKRDSCGGLDAMRKARIEFPDAYERYQAEGHKQYDDAVVKAHENRSQSATGQEFLRKVAEIEAGGKVSKVDALRKARQLYPEEFKAYNGEAA